MGYFLIAFFSAMTEPMILKLGIVLDNVLTNLSSKIWTTIWIFQGITRILQIPIFFGPPDICISPNTVEKLEKRVCRPGQSTTPIDTKFGIDPDIFHGNLHVKFQNRA